MASHKNNENEEHFIKTMNKTGYMTTEPDEFSQQFIAFSAKQYPELVLEIGAAYGVTTHAALKMGANMVVNDLDERHIKILIEKTPAELRHHLHPLVAKMPELGFEPDSFMAILACRILHFLSGSDLRIAIQNIASWLKPGGKLFIVAETPFVGTLKGFTPTYLEHVKSKQEWPGFMDDIYQYVPQRAADLPPIFHALDPVILCREANNAGLIVEEARFFARPEYPTDLQGDGRESVGFIAFKP